MNAWAVVGTIVTAVAALIAAVWVAVLQRRAAPYPALADRVATLETQVDRMRKRIYRLDTDLDVVVDALHEVSDWDGTPPPPTIAADALEVVRRRRKERNQEDP